MGEVWRPDGGASRAVLFGTAKYRSAELPAIPAVEANLHALGERLSDPSRGLFSDRPRNCRAMGAAGKPINSASVGSALADAAREATDLLLVYYTGHGLLDHRGRLHLALADTDPDPETVGFSAVQVESVLGLLGRARARARVLIVDCCYSGRALAAMATEQSVITDQLKRSGTYTLTSTTRTELSFAPPGERQTAFTGALLRALEGPHALTLDEIYTFVHDDLTGRDLPPPQRCAVNAAGNLALLRAPVRTGARHAADADGGTGAAANRPVVPRPAPSTGSAVFVRPLEPPARKRWQRLPARCCCWPWRRSSTACLC
ncbi:caspase family protein [Streptomyces sp. NPDC050610]|uniref:caspase family protein n=1 Tax=Streptomyces sp. NPDC050610 TaxID=3157097 RepID=UPI00341D9377